MAVSFNGTNSVINMGAGSALNIANSATMSLMAWVNLNDTTTVQTIVSKGYDGTHTAYEFTISSNTLTLASFGPGTNGVIWNPITWATGGWHHLYGDYDPAAAGGTWRIFADGTNVVTITSEPVGPISTTKNFHVGGIDINGTDGHFYNGCIADVALFNGTLTGTEITNLASGSLRPNTSMSRTLLGYWALDVPGTLTDLSVNGNNGTGSNLTLCGSSPFVTATLPPTFTQSPIPQVRNRILAY